MPRRKLTEAAVARPKLADFVNKGTSSDTPGVSRAAGTCMLTVRLAPELYHALRLAAVTRSAAGQQPDTQQAIVTAALQDWMKAHGHA
jgi:hypothetical protein